MLATIVFLLCVFLVLWTLAGYPIWLSLRARGRRNSTPVASTPEGDLPTVTAVIPVHNGEAFLTSKLQNVLTSDYPPEKLDIIVLSDGSTDGSDAIAESFVQNGRVRFVRLPKGGKAIALSTAFPMVTADIVLLTDVRQALERDCVQKLVRNFSDPAVGAVSGTLKIRSGETSGEAGTGLYWRYESWIRDNLSAIDSVIGATGPIYAIRRSLARSLPEGCILDDMWLPLQIVLDGYRSTLASDAVAWDYPTSLNSEFNRKVRTQAGLYQLMKLEPRLVNPARNRLFWKFVNLKLGRLFLPHLLIIIAVTSVFLPSPFNVAVLAAQALFYGLYFVDRVLSEGSSLKRITAPFAAFLTLVTAAFFAQTIFFRDPASLWKTTKVRLTDPAAPR